MTDLIKKIEDSPNHLFITGKAGTGKSTLLSRFRKFTQKQVAVVAPTGVAAVNVAGETIHSFFRFGPSINPDLAQREAKLSKNNKIYKILDILIIDEISMVRADLLDSIDVFLRTIRKNQLPFGGVRLVLFGDLFQLPPVVTQSEKEIINQIYPSPYFFSSHVIQNLNQNLLSKLEVLVLEKVYRQRDQKFIDLLNKIRLGGVVEDDLTALNRQLISEGEYDENSIILTTVNQKSDTINQNRLNSIMGVAKTFRSASKGKVNEIHMPAPNELRLKTGAKVMFLNNDPDDRWINGTIGMVIGLSDRSVKVKLNNQEIYEIEPFTWTSYKTEFDTQKKELVASEVGSYTQIPLKLAWAITIHKSQGQTFENMILDLGSGAFAHGQLYVALSRATSLKGIKLARPIYQSDVILDPIVTQYYRSILS